WLGLRTLKCRDWIGKARRARTFSGSHVHYVCPAATGATTRVAPTSSFRSARIRCYRFSLASSEPLARLLQRGRFIFRIKPFTERLRIRCMLEAIADKRRPVGDGAKEIERPDPAFEELHDSLLLTPAVPVRWRHDVNMVREFRADFRSPLFTVQTTHCVPPPRLERPYVLVLFS